MNLKKFFTKKIPSFRHKKELYICDYQSFFYKDKKNNKKNLILHKKILYKTKNYGVTRCISKLNAIVTKNFLYQLKPYKKYIVGETCYNFKVIIPGIENLTIGKILFNLKWSNKKLINFYYKGFIAYLYAIPVFTIFCNVNNLNNTKITYARSSGTYCTLKKNKKTKTKLVSIILPSKQNVMLNKMTKVFIGKNSNFYVNRLVEGKWGFAFHANKTISVRGVAMNPVDHPNGGRAKSVQPEKSPWNWIAKKKK